MKRFTQHVPPAGRRREHGLTMIEVLVALLLTSIGVLGFIALQLRALDTVEGAHYRTQATEIAKDMAERATANPQGFDRYADSGNWDQGAVGGEVPNEWNQCVGTTSNCNANEIADWDILQLRWHAAQMMPNGRISADQCTNNPWVLCITVAWDQTTVADCDPNANQCIRMDVPVWRGGGAS